eukprot:CAMPEP_0113283450 /NCGR_PEP_ID=MMETSP0008_2-20120614/29453_1 /TAXON_ID=97485 /ORGANISM="Prymnesium parvum" /LENGTH=149 /DNA_ID=CAMNT_0000134159 /DNA_START=694 /DNA_END=1145 /DNA_ORIENTATION=- /assembly_acc=CAM_ASM_000153
MPHMRVRLQEAIDSSASHCCKPRPPHQAAGRRRSPLRLWGVALVIIIGAVFQIICKAGRIVRRALIAEALGRTQAGVDFGLGRGMLAIERAAGLLDDEGSEERNLLTSFMVNEREVPSPPRPPQELAHGIVTNWGIEDGLLPVRQHVAE